MAVVTALLMLPLFRTIARSFAMQRVEGRG
jgi:hypothetical protein